MVSDSGEIKNELIVLEYDEIRQQVYFEYMEGDNLNPIESLQVRSACSRGTLVELCSV